MDAVTLLQHEELSKYIAMNSAETQHHPCQFPPMCIQLKSHHHTLGSQPMLIYIYIYIYILCVNFDPQCVWIHVNELHSVFDFLISILKTITIRHAWSDTNYSIEVLMVRNHLVNCISMLSNLNEFLTMLWLPCNMV